MIGEFSAADKHAAIKRELMLRRRNYPRWVAEGRMTQEEADKAITIFEAILEDYRQQSEFAFE